MQELRFVLIIVGALAIAALLFHGLWTSRKEGKSKFSDKPIGKMVDEPPVVTGRDFSAPESVDIVKKDRKEPEFVASDVSDPLLGGYGRPARNQSYEDTVNMQMTVEQATEQLSADEVVSPDYDYDYVPQKSYSQEQEPQADMVAQKPRAADESFEVIVLNVHCAGSEPFWGTKLFDSMQQNGLLYGEMDIFHRHADLSGTGKVLFSVANMMQPGTLAHGDPAQFSTKGISFFMTLPCYGEPEQNFKLMLRTAQQIADDLGGNVLDDSRNLMTPDRLVSYRRQIQQFKATHAK
jgi:cell division protein ZipA